MNPIEPNKDFHPDKQLAFRHRDFEHGSIPHEIREMVRSKKAVDALEEELFDRLKTENEIRRFKRAGRHCPFDKEGFCRNISIRCGERQQFSVPEGDAERRLPHRCNYKPIRTFSDFHVLVVDDDPTIRELCTDFFKSLGIPSDNIDRAESVAEAEERLKNGKKANRQYAMVLTDIRMQKTPGFQLVNHLVERNFNARIFLMSGFAEEKDLPPGYLGKAEVLPGAPVVSSFLKKPISLTELSAHARAVLKELRGDTAAPDAAPEITS